MGKLEGMHTLDQSLAELVRSGIVAKEEAVRKTSSPVKLAKLIRGDQDNLKLQVEPSLNISQ